MRILAATVRICAGIIFAFLCFLALSPAIAALLGDSGITPAVLAAALLAGGLVGLFSRSIRRAFGWSVLALALCVVALPVSTMLLAGRVVVEATGDAIAADRRATALGASLGRRQVILVDRATGHAVAATAYIDEPPRRRLADRIEPPLD